MTAKAEAEAAAALEAPGSRFCPHSIFSMSRLSASLPGSLAASDALGLARSGFEATPVVDADHGVSES